MFWSYSWKSMPIIHINFLSASSLENYTYFIRGKGEPALHVCLMIPSFNKVIRYHVWPYSFLAPLTTSAQRSWWYYWFVCRRPSVNFCFKSLLLLQFLFDHSEFFTGETSHIVPPCNKAGISNFCLEFQKLQKFQISWKNATPPSVLIQSFWNLYWRNWAYSATL